MNKVVLIIRDGWGFSEKTKGNAIKAASTPYDDYFTENYPHTLLKASGNAVGLPKGVQGGSEPGHLTMGAGRIVLQPLELINRSIRDRSFFSNPVLLEAVKRCKNKDRALHLMGLFSDQGVHGTLDHLYSLMELAKPYTNRIYIHAFLDGRDVPEKSASHYINDFKKKRRKIGAGKLVSMIGRYYAMDRDKNYNRTRVAYELLVHGRGEKYTDPLKALESAYDRGDHTDYYVRPIVIGSKPTVIKKGDSVIFWNFRSDRARQITRALTQKIPEFKTEDLNLHLVCMSTYDKKFNLPVAFPQPKVKNNLGEVLSKNKIPQLRIAETEKYAHVTFFFNSQIEKPYDYEDRILINSPKVPSYDEKPEMSAYEITDAVLEKIKVKGNRYGFILINFANPDLVGHSGNFEAVVKCVEVVDSCVGKIVRAGLKNKYVIIVTGDHGNAEIMLYENGEVCPAHGTNPVPFIIIGYKDKDVKLREGGLKDVAPTILEIMDLKKPEEMTGISLIK